MKTSKSQISVPVLTHDAATHAFLSRNFAKDTTGLVEMTPNLASFIFHHLNTRNRPLSAAHVRQYLHDMQSGMWHDTGDGIKIAFIEGTELDAEGKLDDTPGVRLNSHGFVWLDDQNHIVEVAAGARVAVIDGGHRLAALAMALTTPCVVLTLRSGCPLALRRLVDTGRRRTNANQLDIEGVTYATRLDPISKAIHAVMHHDAADVRALSLSSALDEYVMTHRQALAWACPLFGKTGRTFGSAAIVAGFVIAYDAIRRARDTVAVPLSMLDALAVQLQTGTAVSQDAPIWAFREFCINRASLARRPREPRFTMTLRALNAIMWTLNGTTNSVLKGMDVTLNKKQFPATVDGLEFFVALRAKSQPRGVAPATVASPVVASPVVATATVAP